MWHFFPWFIQTVILSIPLNLFTFLTGHPKRLGLENLAKIPRDASVIFACNHKTQADVFYLAWSFGLCSRLLPVYFISIAGVQHYAHLKMSIFYAGLIFKLMGTMPFTKGLGDYEKSFAPHVLFLDTNRRSMCIFVEGKTFKGMELGPVRGGVGYLAKESKAVVIPTAIYRKEGAKLPTVVSYGEPLRYQDYQGDYKAIAENIMKKITGLYNAAHKSYA
jgi:1-acyl-sn-glycerol-3-phosphate acyltransferase